METTVEFQVINKTQYTDEFVIRQIFKVLDNLEEDLLIKLLFTEYNKVIVFNSKEFMGLNFVKGS